MAKAKTKKLLSKKHQEFLTKPAVRLVGSIILFLIGYVFTSWALDSASLLHIVLALFFFLWSLDTFLRFIKSIEKK